MAKPSTYATAVDRFRTDLVRNLFDNTAFLRQSQDWSADALGKTVVYNQSGAKPLGMFNSTTGHGGAVTRTDIRRSFDLDEYITQPTRINVTDEMVINYAKRQEVLADHIAQIDNDTALRGLFRWVQGLPASNILRTQAGVATPAVRVAGAPGATGNRARVVKNDIVAIRSRFIKSNIPFTPGKWNMLVPADMMLDLWDINEFVSKDYIDESPIPQGAMGRRFGFNIWEVPSGVSFNNAATPVANNPKPDDTFTPYAGAATDNQAIIAWHSDYVVRAISPNTTVSIVPVHGGTEFSTTSICGFSPLANNFRGIIALVERI